MSDLIDRQAAIEALKNSRFPGAPYVDAGISIAIGVICDLPFAQPEIVRCKNCKHNQLPSTCGNANCEIFYGMTDQDGFCHMAERRTDDQN